MPKFTSQIKLYRKLRYRKGYGVHSPFIYNLITKVIEEKTPYYIFDEIEKFRNYLLTFKNGVGTVTTEAQHKNYGALLFRLVNFFKCRTVLQIKGSTGIMSLYLALASRSNCNCYILEENSYLLDAVKKVTEEEQIKNIHFMEGHYNENLAKLKTEISSFDLIFINEIADTAKIRELLGHSKSFIHKNSILIIDGINRNKEMKLFWKKIKNDSNTHVTIDLLALGIVFFEIKLHKQHYKNYFDYGKKQNLHKKRRRRLNFISRRKKSTKNKYPD